MDPLALRPNAKPDQPDLSSRQPAPVEALGGGRVELRASSSGVGDHLDIGDILRRIEQLDGPPPHQAPRPLLLTRRELAETLRVSTRTVERLTASGVLPQPVRIGRSVRWRSAEIYEWLAATPR